MVIVKLGNRIVVEDGPGRSYIENLRTGDRVLFRQIGGTFVFDMDCEGFGFQQAGMASAKPRGCLVRPALGKGCWVEVGTLGRGEAEMEIETEFEKVFGETAKDVAAREQR